MPATAPRRGPAGPPGPPGPPGSGGDLNHRHQQLTPSTTWTVLHGLGKRPSVDVFDSAGDPIDGDVEHLTDNSLTITFSAPVGGEAYAN